MSDKKEIKEIDVASLDSELAAARTLEEGKGDKFISTYFPNCVYIYKYSYILWKTIQYVFKIIDILSPRRSRGKPCECWC